MGDLQVNDRCLQCGGTLKANPRSGVIECIYCHRQYRDTSNTFDEEIQEIAKQRQLREFIKAEELCEDLISRQPDNCEAHWQALLAKLGVVYVMEDNKMKPTFFSCSYDSRDSILDDNHYKLAVQSSPNTEVKQYYEVSARELDELLKEFFNLVKNEEYYDIFISFKHMIAAKVGNQTKYFESDDYKKAKEIYERLKDKYRVFFSPVSIGQDAGIIGEKYEPRILKALQSSQAMVLVGFSEENLKSQWVENEWRRFRYYIEKGKKAKHALIYVYEKNVVLPPALKEIELPMVDTFDGNYLDTLEKKLEFVQTKKGLKSKISAKKLNTDFDAGSDNFGYSTTTRTVITVKGNKQAIKVDATEDRDLDTAFGMLEHSCFSDAEKKFKKIVQKNKESHKAYLGIFMSKIKAKNRESIPAQIINASPSDFQHLDNAISYSPNESFSWGIIDALMLSFDTPRPWKKLKPTFDFLIKYLDVPRIEKLHKDIGELCQSYVSSGNTKESEEIFESAKGMFIEEVRNSSIELIRDYADSLLGIGKYNLAGKHFEQLAAINVSSESYIKLLAARLHSEDTTKVRLKFGDAPKNEDEEKAKKLSELTLDEIIERIVICDYKERAANKLAKFRLILPSYKIRIQGHSTSNSIAAAVKKAMNTTIAEAREYISEHRIMDVHVSMNRATEAAEALEAINVPVEEIEMLKPSYEQERSGATLEQIIKAVQDERGYGYEEAKRYVNDNSLYRSVYMSREEAEAGIARFEKSGIRDVTIFEDIATDDSDDSEAFEIISQMLLYQVKYNLKSVQPFMETVVSCYRQLEDKEKLIEILYLVADECVKNKKFAQANIWYNEVIIEDPNQSSAHWGTLKCRLKAVDDYGVAKHRKKINSMQEFNNALNCADNDQHKYYMTVFYNELPKRQGDKKEVGEVYAKPKFSFKHLIWELIRYVILIAYIFAGFVLLHDPEIFLSKIDIGWLIAVAAILFIISLHKARKSRKTAMTNFEGYSPYVQNMRYRVAICRVAIVWVAIIIFAAGIFMAFKSSNYSVLKNESDITLSYYSEDITENYLYDANESEVNE